MFKPKVRYSYICVVEDKKTSSRSTRYVFPSPRKSVFKKYGHYKYTPRPASPKDFSPKPKMVNRYVFHLKRSTRYVFPSPTPRKSVFKKYGHYKYTPRPASPKDFSPKPKEVNRYACQLKRSVTINPTSKAGQTNKTMFRNLMLLNAKNQHDNEDNNEVPMEKIDEEKTEVNEDNGDPEQVKNEPAVVETTDHIEEVGQDKMQEVTENGQEDKSKDKIKISQNEDREIPQSKDEETKPKDEIKKEPPPKANNDSEIKQEVGAGLWFNPELRKKIQVTAKGWELRGAA